MKKIKDFNAAGIILSGGPSSVYDKKAPKIDKPYLFAWRARLGYLLRHAAYGEALRRQA